MIMTNTPYSANNCSCSLCSFLIPPQQEQQSCNNIKWIFNIQCFSKPQTESDRPKANIVLVAAELEYQLVNQPANNLNMHVCLKGKLDKNVLPHFGADLYQVAPTSNPL